MPLPVTMVAVGDHSTIVSASANGLAWLGDDGSGAVEWWPLGSGGGISGIGMASAFVHERTGFEDEGGVTERTCLMIGGEFHPSRRRLSRQHRTLLLRHLLVSATVR